jgi:hypothetical protein
MAERVIGAQALQRRLHALQNMKLGPKVLRTLALSTVREAKILVPRRTGNLGRSIHVASVTATNAIVEAGAGYAGFVEFGTRPHEITPRARKALRWAATGAGARFTGSPRKAALRGALGGVRFATRVHHPGTRPHPFLLAGAKRAVAKSHLMDVVVSEWNGAA